MSYPSLCPGDIWNTLRAVADVLEAHPEIYDKWCEGITANDYQVIVTLAEKFYVLEQSTLDRASNKLRVVQ